MRWEDETIGTVTDGKGIAAPPVGPVLGNQSPSTFHPKWTHGERAGAYQVPALLLSLMFYTDAVHSRGVQDAPPPNMSLLCEDYFELKAVEILGVDEKLPYYPEELKLGLFPSKESVPVINVTKVALSVCQGKHLPGVCFSSFHPGRDPPILGKPQAPTLTLSSGWHIDLIFPLGLRPSHVCGIPVCKN